MKNIYRFIILSFAIFGFFSQSKAQVAFHIDTISSACGAPQTVTVPVKVNNFQNVGSFQFVLYFDPARFTYVGHTPLSPAFTQSTPSTPVLFDIVPATNGQLAVTWVRVGGMSVSGDTTIFSVTLNYNGGGFGLVGFNLSASAPLSFEVADPASNVIPSTSSNGGVTNADTQSPSVICPANVLDTSASPIVVNNIGATSVSDNCGVSSSTFSISGATNLNGTGTNASGSTFQPGTSIVTYSATDASGNSASCSFNVQIVNLAIPPSGVNDTLTLITVPGPLQCGQNSFYMDVLANHFDSLGSLQFTVEWNEAFLSFDSIGLPNPALNLNTQNYNLTQVSNGLFGLSWTVLNPSIPFVTLPDGSRLFRVYFSLLTSGNINSALTFGNVPVPIEAYNNANPPGYEVPVKTLGSTIVVTDTINPSLVCPPTVTVQANSGQGSATVNNVIATFSDNCSSPSISYEIFRNGQSVINVPNSNNASGSYPLGTSTVVFTVVDQAGNTNICFTDITVTDPGAVTIYIDSLDFGCISSGVISVPVRVANFANVAGVQFAMTWNDQILSYQGIQYPNAQIQASSFTSATPPGFLQYAVSNSNGLPDLMDGDTMFNVIFNVLSTATYSNVQFVSLPPLNLIGAYDANGDQLTIQTQNGYVYFGDNAPPVFNNCPGNITVNIPFAECSIFYNWPNISVSDDCGAIASLDSNFTSHVFNTGVTNILYTATDVSGNNATCAFSITVLDPIAPQFTTNCPTSFSVSATTGACNATASWVAPVAFDACDQATVTPTSNFAPGAVFPVGNTTVVYTATDQSGNTRTCSFVVTVTENEDPLITCPADVVVTAPLNSCSTTATWSAATATDNCDTNLSLSSNVQSGSSFNAGFSTVTYTATDDSGNTATCAFVVTVQESTPPTIVCPQSITQEANANNGTACGANVVWSPPVVSDNCDNSLFATTSTPSGSFFAIGPVNTVTFQVIDDSGNTATCSFNVTITDTTKPVFTYCPDSISVTLSPNECSTIVNWVEPTVADVFEPCGLSTFFVVGNFDAPDTLTVGNYTITYLAIDNNGNFSECKFVVQVRDTVPPVLVACPTDTVISITSCSTLFNFDLPAATDNCDNNVTVTSTPASGVLLPVGTVTTYKIFARDNYQNFDSCQFTVTIAGNTLPTVLCPNNITVPGCSWNATWAQPTLSGFCDLPVALTVAPYDTGSVIPAGIHNITYTGTDASGTMASCSFQVTVQDNVNPIITCPANMTVDVAGNSINDPSNFLDTIISVANCTAAQLTFANPSAIDNCGNVLVSLTSGLASGGNFPVGTTVLVFRATDASGNTSSCSASVTVVGYASTVTLTASGNPACAGSPLVISAPNIPGATYTWAGPGSNYPNTSSITVPNVTAATAGIYRVTITSNGCVYNAGDGLAISVGTAPNAVDDLGFSLQVGQTDSLKILDNDTGINTGDFVYTLLNAPAGVSDFGNGVLLFSNTAASGVFTFQYELCSELCETLCDTATVTVTVKQVECLYIPNLITPNGDDLNDEFLIPCLEYDAYPDNSLVIYNQWGDQVYEAAPYKPFPKSGAWKGTYKNDDAKPLPDGVYFYIFRSTPTAAPQKGFIEIFR